MESTCLYGKSKTGKSLFWRIWMEPCQEGKEGKEGFQVITEHGEVGTSNPQQTKPTYFFTGKNIGKSNETTAKQQAEQYMKRKYTDKVEKQGYTTKSIETTDHAEHTNHLQSLQSSTSRMVYPMLANKIAHSKLSSLEFPAYAQPKLDGVRCIALLNNGEIELYSRTGKRYTGLWMIEPQLEKVFEKRPDIVMVDGELGCFPTGEDMPSMTFQEVCGYVKRKNKKADDEEHTKIEFHIFDIIMNQDYPWVARYQIMKSLDITVHSCSQLALVETRIIPNHTLFLKYHQENIERGFEGTMYRRASGKYVEKYRSRDLLKYKDMMTEEYPIIGAVEGKGNDAGTVVWIVNVNGKTCKVRPKGTRAERTRMLQQAHSYIGKQLTVQFQEFTDDGLPRFPVGLVVRDYE